MTQDTTTTSSSSAAAPGAGRWQGTSRRRASGPAPRAGRLAAARDRELGRRRGIRQEPLRVRRHLVRRQGQGFPARDPLLRRRADEVLRRRPYRLRREDFGELQHHDGISPAWPITLRRARAVLHQGGAAVRGPWRARRGPDRPSASAPYPFPAVTHEPRIQQLSDDLAGRAITRSMRRAASDARRRHAEQPVHPLRDLRRVPVASCRPSRMRRSSASDPLSSTRMSPC